MAQEERSREMPHSVILEGREKLTISGVTDVHSFDEEQVLLETVRRQPVSADIRRVSGHAGVYEQPAGHARAAKPAARCRDRGGV